MSKINKFVLKPVKIYLNELEEIFKILNTQFEDNNLLIESENYIYKDFDDLSKSPEEIIYYLKIESLIDKRFIIIFSDKIDIEYQSDDFPIKAIAYKIKCMLSNRAVIKNRFIYYFNKLSELIYILIVFGIPLFFSKYLKINQIFSIFSFIYIILLIFLFIYFSSFIYRKKLLFSTIILYKFENLKNLKSSPKGISKLELFKLIFTTLSPFLIFILQLIFIHND